MINYLIKPSIFKLPIELIRSSRKSLSIEVLDNLIKVRTPYFTSLKTINTFINKNENWVMKKIKEIESRKTVELKYINGEKIKVMGKNFNLKFSSKNSEISKIDGSTILINLKKNNFSNKVLVKSEILKLLKKFAETVLFNRTHHYSKLIGDKPKTIRVKEYKSKWGSCSFKGDIVFNWKIIFAPIEIVDYLVVHELCHLEHQNHSFLFWNKVEKFLSDYPMRRKWLKIHSYQLTL